MSKGSGGGTGSRGGGTGGRGSGTGSRGGGTGGRGGGTGSSSGGGTGSRGGGAKAGSGGGTGSSSGGGTGASTGGFVPAREATNPFPTKGRVGEIQLQVSNPPNARGAVGETLDNAKSDMFDKLNALFGRGNQSPEQGGQSPEQGGQSLETIRAVLDAVVDADARRSQIIERDADVQRKRYNDQVESYWQNEARKAAVEGKKAAHHEQARNPGYVQVGGGGGGGGAGGGGERTSQSVNVTPSLAGIIERGRQDVLAQEVRNARAKENAFIERMQQIELGRAISDLHQRESDANLGEQQIRSRLATEELGRDLAREQARRSRPPLVKPEERVTLEQVLDRDMRRIEIQAAEEQLRNLKAENFAQRAVRSINEQGLRQQLRRDEVEIDAKKHELEHLRQIRRMDPFGDLRRRR